MTTDPLAATVALLLGRASVTAIASTRIYGEELPDDDAFVAAMPQTAVAIQSAGGTGAGDASYLPIGGQRLDVSAYGSTIYLARRLMRAVHAELKGVVREVVAYNDETGTPTSVLLHAYMVSTGAVALREPTTRWPRVMRTYVLVYDERPVP